MRSRQCGACTVLADGRRINSCLALAVSHDGAQITTIEGLAQVAAATLNMPIEFIDARLGDSIYPRSPVSGGPQSAAGVTPAVEAAAKQAQLKLLTASAGDAGSPLHGLPVEELDFKQGRIIRKGRPESGEALKAFLERNGNKPLGASPRQSQIRKRRSTPLIHGGLCSQK